MFSKNEKGIWKSLQSEKFLRFEPNIIDRWKFFSCFFGKSSLARADHLRLSGTFRNFSGTSRTYPKFVKNCQNQLFSLLSVKNHHFAGSNFLQKSFFPDDIFWWKSNSDNGMSVGCKMMINFFKVCDLRLESTYSWCSSHCRRRMKDVLDNEPG